MITRNLKSNPSPSLGRALLTLSLVLLAACGSGDSASSRRPEACFEVFKGDCLTNVELEARAQELAAEFKARREQILTDAWGTEADSFSWYLERINVAEAQAHLQLSRGGEEANVPGKGVTIGFIDSGIREQHEAFDSTSSVTEELLPGAVDEGPDEFSHGTAVASVAAGRYGIAYGADIKMFAIPLGDGLAPYDPITPNQLSAVDFESAEIYRYVFSKDIDILNLSFSFQGGIEGYSESGLRNNYTSTIEVLAQEEQEDKTILVWAAGNAGNRDIGRATSSSPEILAGLVARIEELQGHSIAVVSIEKDGNIADFSNHCGIARDFCIAAPGKYVGVASKGNNLWSLANGTSFSAPLVSGSLAVMKQLFRGQLSNEQLVTRLFDTAKDDGIYADHAIYGHGLLDLGAATKPWGEPGFMGIGQSTSATGTPMTASSLAAGPALGDALSHALGSQDVAAFDTLGAPFWFDTGAFTVAAPGTTVAARLQEFLYPVHRQPIPQTWQFHLQEAAPALETGHLALANGASRLTMVGPQGISAAFFQGVQQRPSALVLSWTPEPLPMLSIGVGYVHEPESLLGSQASGTFGQLSAETAFLSAGLNTTAGRWTLAAVGEVGAVQPSVASGPWIDHISSLTTSAFRLQAGRTFDNSNALRLSLSQPLRVDHGAAVFSLPTGRTQDGVVTGTSFSSPLAPSGQQLDLTATLAMPLAAGDLSLGVTRSRQPGHQHTAAPEWTVFTGYQSMW